MNVSQIIAAYKLFLQREPENDDVINEKLCINNFDDLIREFTSSKEFCDKYPNIIETANNFNNYLTIKDMHEATRYILPQDFIGEEPTLKNPVSQLCTYSQFNEPEYKFFCNLIKEEFKYHRKQWEYVYILNALAKNGKLKPGMKGLGFGCGKEPLPSVFVNYGTNVTITDQPPSNAKKWVKTNQYGSTVSDYINSNICNIDKFINNVNFEFVDMNDIPEKFIGQFDFVWSCCALEHLGSIKNGINFIKNAHLCLKHNGLSVHTTEFNLCSLIDTWDMPGECFFRKSDIEILNNFTTVNANYSCGNTEYDKLIDIPPYERNKFHIKLLHFGFVHTSIGIILNRLNDKF